MSSIVTEGVRRCHILQASSPRRTNRLVVIERLDRPGSPVMCAPRTLRQVELVRLVPGAQGHPRLRTPRRSWVTSGEREVPDPERPTSVLPSGDTECPEAERGGRNRCESIAGRVAMASCRLSAVSGASTLIWLAGKLPGGQFTVRVNGLSTIVRLRAGVWRVSPTARPQ